MKKNIIQKNGMRKKSEVEIQTEAKVLSILETGFAKEGFDANCSKLWKQFMFCYWSLSMMALHCQKTND